MWMTIHTDAFKYEFDYCATESVDQGDNYAAEQVQNICSPDAHSTDRSPKLMQYLECRLQEDKSPQQVTLKTLAVGQPLVLVMLASILRTDVEQERGKRDQKGTTIRNVSISGVSWKDPKTMLTVWNSHYERVYENCARAGPDRCMAVRYEQLVLRPRESMKKVLQFLNLPWDEVVLNHEKNVDDLVLVKKEKSTNQVVYPIYTNALTDWANDRTIMTPELLSEMAGLSMLRKFGYSEMGMPPNYGTPEPEVLKKSAELQKSVDFKRLFHEPV